MQLGFIVILIIAIFVAIFAIQNGTPVPVDLFFARYEMPLAVIMMVCLILGAVILLILGTTRQFKKRSEQKELKNKIKIFETEKAQNDINIKALESDKQNLMKTNEELNAKVTELKDKIKMQEGLLTEKVRELEVLKTQGIGENVTEIIDEGAKETDNENSEVESQ
jgi:uncharacterized integral membrane protein